MYVYMYVYILVYMCSAKKGHFRTQLRTQYTITDPFNLTANEVDRLAAISTHNIDTHSEVSDPRPNQGELMRKAAASVM